MSDKTIDELISRINAWQIEASSGHNDGWVRQHYQEKLDHLRAAINKAYDGEDPEDELDNYD